MADTTPGHNFHRGAPQEEALARLAYAAENHLRLALITGEPGVGKTAVLREFAREQARQGVFVANLPASESQRMLWSLAAQWGLFPERNAPLAALWQDIADRLVQLRYENRSGVVLIDDLQNEADTLRLIRQLAGMDSHPDCRLSLIAACDSGTLAELPRSFKQLIDLHVELEPWELADTEVAASHSQFTPDALDELQSLTNGVARQVSRLARFASLAATAERLDAIDSDTLIAVQDDLLVS